jgi:hypothetical protein
VLHIDTLGKPSGAYITHSFEQVRETRFQARSSKTRVNRQNKTPHENCRIAKSHEEITDHENSNRQLKLPSKTGDELEITNDNSQNRIADFSHVVVSSCAIQVVGCCNIT